MVHPSFAHLAPGVIDPTWADVGPGLTKYHLLDMPWVQPEDISAAVLWLASDEARYVTGVALPVDGGALTMPPGYRSPSDGTATQ
jgi:(+)-trans-carveol dehydrogenase